MIQNLKGTNLFSQKKKKIFEREKSKKIKKHIILDKRPKKKKNEKTSCSKLRGFETGMKWIGFGLNEPILGSNGLLHQTDPQ